MGRIARWITGYRTYVEEARSYHQVYRHFVPNLAGHAELRSDQIGARVRGGGRERLATGRAVIR